MTSENEGDEEGSTIRGRLCVVSARGLAHACASYCVVSLVDPRHADSASVLQTTACAARSRAPQWHASVAFAHAASSACLEVAVWRAPHRVGPLARPARRLGAALVPLAPHAEHGRAEGWHPLYAAGHATGAAVCTALECFWEHGIPADPQQDHQCCASSSGSSGGIYSGLLQPLDALTAGAMLLPREPPPPPPCD